MTCRYSRMTGALAALTVTLLLGAGCGSSPSQPRALAPAGTAATTAPSRALRVLVTNDDGYSAAGIDAVVEGLRALPDTEVTVVAPLTNQSGTGGKTTSGALTVTDVKTASGYAAKAVDGYPADTIVWAIDQHGIAFNPDVVISGINFGQNVGRANSISGTVGAARAAAARGIPALAASQALPDPVDFPAGVTQVLSWLSGHRAAILDGSARSPMVLHGLNVPTCVTGAVRGLVEVPISAREGTLDLAPSDCTSTKTGPADDEAGLAEGFATLSNIPLTAS